MTRKFKDRGPGRREVYTPPYDLAGLAQIISNNTDKYNRWDVYITIGCVGNYIFGPYGVEICTSDRTWRVQSADTIYDLRMGEGHTEEEGSLQDCSAESIHAVLKKAHYK